MPDQPNTTFDSRRPLTEERCFSSPSLETAMADIAASLQDREVAWLFANCLPNTLDTTVTVAQDTKGRPDTFVITGDIDAMWLRDSTNQVWPYLSFVNDDPTLKSLIQGVINRQIACVLLDPYANAFYREPVFGHWVSDRTEMRPGVHERKYELDSLCAVLRLSCGYYAVSKDTSCLDEDWQRALQVIINTIRTEQAGTGEETVSPYKFERSTTRATETLPLEGHGHPVRRCGLSRSPFRPSDDAAHLPFLVPANAMAVAVLRQTAAMLNESKIAPEMASQAATLAEEIANGIRDYAVVNHPRCGAIYAYEIDGFGSHYLMDDANIPSLLSLPYLGFCDTDDAIYRNTRAFVLSENNPYYAVGKAGKGGGGPHVGLGWIWPMSIIMQALTSDSDEEISACLSLLKSTHAGTGFMHETFWKDDASRFTRHWFAWANSLFGELILKLNRERPQLLRETVF